jgi:ribosomal protein S1
MDGLTMLDEENLVSDVPISVHTTPLSVEALSFPETVFHVGSVVACDVPAAAHI